MIPLRWPCPTQRVISLLFVIIHLQNSYTMTWYSCEMVMVWRVERIRLQNIAMNVKRNLVPVESWVGGDVKIFYFLRSSRNVIHLDIGHGFPVCVPIRNIINFFSLISTLLFQQVLFWAWCAMVILLAELSDGRKMIVFPPFIFLCFTTKFGVFGWVNPDFTNRSVIKIFSVDSIPRIFQYLIIMNFIIFSVPQTM